MPTSKRNIKIDMDKNKEAARSAASFKESQKEKFSLKDHLFNIEKVEQLASEIKNVCADFDDENFIKEIIKEFPRQELKERMYNIRDNLHTYLSKNNNKNSILSESEMYRQNVNIILKALPKELDLSKTDDDFGDFIHAPYAEYISHYGCNQKDFDFSLDALYEINKRFSCEFAIRNFINLDTEKSLKILEKWSQDKNYHIRRLTSEGTRNRLPWGKKISLDYKDTEKILDKLFFDKTRYVTRSVANHMHDIAKVDLDYALNKLKSWQESKNQNETEMNYIINHSLRSQIKSGNEKVLELIGIKNNLNLEIKNFKLENNEVKIGDRLYFSFDIINQEKENVKVNVNYIIYFADKNKNISKSKKIYTIKKIDLDKNIRNLHLEKSHLFKKDMTTKKIYSGMHAIELQINGVTYKKEYFYIVD